MTVIDTHGHVIPPNLVAAMRQGTAPDGIRIEENGDSPVVVHRQGYRYPLVQEFFDVEARLASMDAAGTDISVISVAPPLFLYWTEVEGAAAAARTINDAVAAMVDQGRGRFFGLANLPMQSPDDAAKELRRTVTTLGMRGAQIGPHVEGVPLDDPSLRPVLEAAVELDVPLVLHPYYVGSSPDLDDYYLTNLQGNPWQTAVAASRLIFSGILDELPDLKVVLVHGGGHLPFQIGRLDHGHRVRPEAKRPRRPPSEYLRRFHYDTLTHSRESTDWLIQRVGADRVMFGTDIPFDMAGGTFPEQVTDAAGRTAVSSENATRLFNLNGAPR
ncbi:amidohydrolase family protein [Ruania zhangjianzhongii]|uniref:amidohydrolase family protein n=1 Tax=Ruania zhangjianzhongii TaxID=2603206 RepID=UPI0011CB9BC1|nr:amidohydrolase family protein [Ruania zhangjianzhongii]